MAIDWQHVLLAGKSPLALRPVGKRDLAFLERLYASTREEELAAVDWAPQQKARFLAQQFQAQHRHYQEHHGDAAFLVIERNGERIGRIYLQPRTDEIRLIDIALLPELRGRGIGSAMLERLLDHARDRSLAVRLHVESFNPAFRLYRRLGFRTLEDRGVYQFMEWRPDRG